SGWRSSRTYDGCRVRLRFNARGEAMHVRFWMAMAAATLALGLMACDKGDDEASKDKSAAADDDSGDDEAASKKKSKKSKKSKTDNNNNAPSLFD
ncbi:MAG TPA: hypothetical protein VJ201_05060, partial [Candidatus Babeliales bacterium]|nr:hypothetical protein [Candidatus Babeliales bacterium]